MRQWERELALQHDIVVATRKETAMIFIRFCDENKISEDKVREYLSDKYQYDDEEIDKLMEEALASTK